MESAQASQSFDLANAKHSSLVAKWIGVAVILVGSALKGIGVLTLEMGDIAMAAASIVLLFSDVSINLLVDKFRSKV